MKRAVAIGLVLAVATFLVLIARAVVLYPGGTWFQPNAIGHDLLRNFLCDLTQPVALNGAANPGARYAIRAMIAIDVGLLLLFLSIPWLCEPSRLTRYLYIAAVVSFVGIFAVPFTPSLEHGLVHAAAVLTGAIPGIVAAVLANLLLRSSRHRRLFALGVAILVVSTVDAVLYMHHVAFSGPPVVALPIIQRAALALLLLWMLAVAITLLRRRR